MSIGVTTMNPTVVVDRYLRRESEPSYTIMLLNPSEDFEPKNGHFSSEHLGLAYLAAHLVGIEGLNIVVLDGAARKLGVDQVCEEIRLHSPNLLAVTCLQYGYEAIRRICERVRVELPNTKICIGGLFISSCSCIWQHLPHADFYIVGEGEYILRELVEGFLRGSSFGSLENAEKIVRLSGNRYLIRAKVIENLDGLLHPLRPSPEFDPTMHYALIQSSRGCEHHCTFCTTHAIDTYSNWRPRSPESIVSEILQIKRIYNPQRILFVDDNFIGEGKPGFDRAREIAERLVASNICIPFAVACRIDSIDRDLFNHLVQAGLRWIYIGIDSVCDGQLRRYNKGYDADFVMRKYRETKRLAVTAIPLLIMFDPYVTLDEIRMNLKNIIACGMQSQLSEITNRLHIICGSAMEARCAEEHILQYSGPIPRYNFIHDGVESAYTNFLTLSNEIANTKVEHRLDAIENLAIDLHAKGDVTARTLHELREKAWNMRKRYFQSFIEILSVSHTLSASDSAIRDVGAKGRTDASEASELIKGMS